MIKEYFTHSAEETRELARKIAGETPDGTVFSLDGNLGAGKTVFASGFARGLGITEPVSSPTFTIVQEYPRPNGSMFFHLDLYRIDNADAALSFGIDEFLYDPHAITLVEWPERIDGLFPQTTVFVKIERTAEETTRKITLRSEK